MNDGREFSAVVVLMCIFGVCVVLGFAKLADLAAR